MSAQRSRLGPARGRRPKAFGGGNRGPRPGYGDLGEAPKREGLRQWWAGRLRDGLAAVVSGAARTESLAWRLAAVDGMGAVG